MIILKYGDITKLNAKRVKVKCPFCGCKVLLDEEDDVKSTSTIKSFNFNDDVIDIGVAVTWKCPTCDLIVETEKYSTFRKFHKSKIGKFWFDTLDLNGRLAIIIFTTLALMFGSLLFKTVKTNHEFESTYAYKIGINSYTDSYRIEDGCIIFEDQYGVSMSMPEANTKIQKLKEEAE